MSEELKPCPFCGFGGFVEQLDSGNWSVTCANEESCLVSLTWGSFARKAEAIAAWNTRSTEAALRAENELMRGLVEDCATELRIMSEWAHGPTAEAYAAKYDRLRNALAQVAK